MSESIGNEANLCEPETVEPEPDPKLRESKKKTKHSNHMKRLDVAIVFKNSGYKHFVINNANDVIRLTSLLCNALRETGDISNFIIVDRGKDCTCNFTI